jgi:outer membrane protein assembly factor BamB
MKPSASCLALLLAAPTAFAASPDSFDWPQWQGQGRDAISRERGLLQQWPKDGPPLAWKVKDLGGGYSAPSVAAGRVFGMSNRDGGEVVWALSEKDGKELWAKRLGPAFRQRPGQGKEGPGCTPTVDGKRLYALGLGGDLACLQVEDGKILWLRNLMRDFGGRLPRWSYRESPLVDADKVICTPGGPGATLVALDKLTGRTAWKSRVPGNPAAAYASAIAFTFDGVRQYVQFTQRGVVGVAADNGRFLWHYDRPASHINCTTPVYHDGKVFATAAYGAGGGLVQLHKTDQGGIDVEQVYFNRRLQNHHGGVILLNGYLYGASGGNEGGALVCLDFKTGRIVWDRRDAGRRPPKGAIAFADNRLYYRTENGTMYLIEPSPKGYIECSHFEPPDRSNRPAWPHPVIANGKLYLRDQEVMLCYAVKAK